MYPEHWRYSIRVMVRVQRSFTPVSAFIVKLQTLSPIFCIPADTKLRNLQKAVSIAPHAIFVSFSVPVIGNFQYSVTATGYFLVPRTDNKLNNSSRVQACDEQLFPRLPNAHFFTFP